MNNKFYNDYFKRSIDFFLSAGLICVLLLPMIIIAVLIKLTSEGPVFYLGERGGYKGKPFYMYKYRTMLVNAEQLGGPTTGLNDPRVTKIGRILRKIKLDEVPQLFNIIKGEMSFVGPRPEVLKYVNWYNDEEKNILSVRPGITDISSLNLISLDEIVGETNVDENFEQNVLPKKNAMRLQYVKTQSFWLDAKIFFLTVWSVASKIFRVISKHNRG